jgi:hypothetical protein
VPAVNNRQKRVLFYIDIIYKACTPLWQCAIEPLSLINAQMAKLVDALVSGTSVSNDVQVRVLFWAHEKTKDKSRKTKGFLLLSFYFYLLSCFRPDGEIGRHASLRGWCRLRCASSSLVLGTKKTRL